MTPRPSQSWPPVLLLVVTLLLSLAMPTTQQQPTPQITLHKNCTEKCGDVSIPYPFGIGPGCSLPGFEVVCNKTFDPPRPFVARILKWPMGGNYSTNDEANQAGTIGAFDNAGIITTTTRVDATYSPIELVDVSVGVGEARVYGTFSFDCEVNKTYRSSFRQAVLMDGPFHIDIDRNVLIGIGANVNSKLTSSVSGGAYGSDIISCVSKPIFSDNAARDGAGCNGLGCCNADITKALHIDQLVVVVNSASSITPWESENCSFGMLVEKDWYNYTSKDVYGDTAYFAKKFPRGFPLVVDFTIRNGSCPAEGQPRPKGYACLSGNSSCINATDGHRCRCWDGYEGNPYVPTGCQDINECMGKNNCTGDHQTCINTIGSYYCGCKRGTRRDGETCAEIFPLPAKVAVGN